jgi:hypothetical protein
LEADHHEGGEEKKHDVDERDDLNAGMAALNWRGQLHEKKQGEDNRGEDKELNRSKQR